MSNVQEKLYPALMLFLNMLFFWIICERIQVVLRTNSARYPRFLASVYVSGVLMIRG